MNLHIKIQNELNTYQCFINKIIEISIHLIFLNLKVYIKKQIKDPIKNLNKN